jgi:hypothetical protein
MTLNKILPPSGWVVLKRDGWYYPAYILTETPRTYALIWRQDGDGPCRYERNFHASDAAARFHKGLMRHAALRPLEQEEGYVVHTEARERQDAIVLVQKIGSSQ